MSTIGGNVLKIARVARNMHITKAARGLNVSERQLYKLESGELKNKDEKLYLDAMVLYEDLNIGIDYLNSNAVFQYLFGKVSMTNPLTAAAKYAAESESDDQAPNTVLLHWGLSGGTEPLLDRLIKRIRNAMDALIDLHLNLTQNIRFAH